jgi:hypothetical protein
VPSSLTALSLLTVALAAPVLAAGDARAEDELLRGPHPFLKMDELDLHAGYSNGLGDNVRGLRLQADYSYRLARITWFDVQMGLVSGSCRSKEISCGDGTGNSVDVVAGAAWKFQTRIPLIFHGRADVGPIFLFPDGARSSAGFIVRAAAGAHYFLFDWFGVGAELGGTWGAAFFRAPPRHSAQLGSMEGSVGVALQF